jgi:hypothetical protein
VAVCVVVLGGWCWVGNRIMENDDGMCEGMGWICVHPSVLGWVGWDGMSLCRAASMCLYSCFGGVGRCSCVSGVVDWT